MVSKCPLPRLLIQVFHLGVFADRLWTSFPRHFRPDLRFHRPPDEILNARRTRIALQIASQLDLIRATDQQARLQDLCPL